MSTSRLFLWIMLAFNLIGAVENMVRGTLWSQGIALAEVALAAAIAHLIRTQVRMAKLTLEDKRMALLQVAQTECGGDQCSLLVTIDKNGRTHCTSGTTAEARPYVPEVLRQMADDLEKQNTSDGIVAVAGMVVKEEEK